MIVIEVELELEDERFCNGCKLITCNDFYGDPMDCILDMDWSIAYHYIGIINKIDGEIITSNEFLARFENAYHSKDGWCRKCLRPQECIDRARKE